MEMSIVNGAVLLKLGRNKKYHPFTLVLCEPTVAPSRLIESRLYEMINVPEDCVKRDAAYSVKAGEETEAMSIDFGSGTQKFRRKYRQCAGARVCPIDGCGYSANGHAKLSERALRCPTHDVALEQSEPCPMRFFMADQLDADDELVP